MPVFTDEAIQTLFGREDAENEVPARLKEFFFRNKAYENLTANLPIRILVGHKGTGKSALLKMAYEEDQENDVLSLWLRPDDVRTAAPKVNDGDINARIISWKQALTELIAREIAEEYGDRALEKIVPENVHARAFDIIGFAKELFSTKLNKGISTVKNSIVQNFQNENKIVVYIDDLDRGWEGSASDIRNISALLNAMRDLCGSRNSLQFRLGLRSDVYYLVRRSDESTDKIEQNLIFLTWDNHQILVVIVKRIEAFFGRQLDEKKLIDWRQKDIGAHYLRTVIDPVFQGSGKWENADIHRILLSLVRRRPRDLIKLLSGAAREAYRGDHTIITTSDLRSTFEAYSNERLQDLENEFRTELPNISNLIRGMRPVRSERKGGKASSGERINESQFRYTNDQLSKKLKDLIDQNRFIFANKQRADIHSLGQLLYKIDFIIGRKDLGDGSIVRRYFDQNRYLQDQFVDFGFDWEVHPAYRWALQPAGVLDVFRSIDLDTDL